MSARVYKLAYLVSHPIQYQAPLLRHLARQEDLDLTVFFLSDLSTRGYADRGFGARVEWDVPLLGGYRHELLEAWSRRDRLGFFQPLTRGLRRRLAEGGFDALWVHGYFHQANLRAIRAARSLGIKVLLRGESTLLGKPADGLGQRVKRALQERLLAQVDACLAIGTRNREFYEQRGVEDERIFAMPYAVDNAFFQDRVAAARERREELRAELELEPGRPVVLYASKFLPRKRPLDLLRAYRALSPDGRAEPAPYLLFVGDGEQRAEAEAEAAATGWGSIRFLGFRNQTELPRFYDLCDVFVLPSDYEPWGLVVNEAMNAGKPVVTSDGVGAAADLIADGVNGYTVPVGAQGVLATRLRELCGDPATARRMGAASLERIDAWSFESDYRGLVHALERTVAA